VGSGKASELAQKEGLAGAFFKGAITTLLATPCSGPGLTTALAWCRGKPPHLVYLVFACLALGMALPYILIGLNPRLVRMLPKPGAWMETFKQTMGFVLLGTVVYLFTFLPAPIIVPTIALIFGLWAACWWIGRTPVTAEFPQMVRAWLFAGAFACLVGWLSLSWLAGVMNNRFSKSVDREISQRQSAAAELAKVPKNEHELPWQPFSEERLEKLLAEKKTVLVDFTADWCPTCKVLEATVLNTKQIRQAVDEHKIETLVADWTARDPKIREMLNALESDDIPVLAIFPATDPNRPIVLRGGYTQSMLIKRIKEAAPVTEAVKAASVTREQFPLPWQPFSAKKLADLKAENKTVLVNFTADWDHSVKILEKVVLNTKEVRQVVMKHKIVALTADWTERNKEVENAIQSLGQSQIPVLAIYPAGRPDDPIVLVGGYTQRTVIKRIEEAVALSSGKARASTAMK